jgi:L-aminopeptidase/D-esterase-like protein
MELKRIAIMASDGFARSLRPVHTPFDGDTLFALSTAKHALAGDRLRELTRIGNVAADCVARAIARGVYEAATLGDAVCYRDRFSVSSASA